MKPLIAALTLALCAPSALTQRPATPTNPPQFGPYNALFIPDGPGIRTPIGDPHDPILLPDTPWTISCWIEPSAPPTGRQLIAGLGDVTSEYPRYLAFAPGKLSLWMGTANELSAPLTLPPGQWTLLTATFDGSQIHLYARGQELATGHLLLGSALPVLQMAPPVMAPAQQSHFAGHIAAFTVRRRALTPAEIKQLAATPPDPALIIFEEASKPWPIQSRAFPGYRAPQDPSTLPTSRAPAARPATLRRPPVGDSFTSLAPGEWSLSDGWTLREAPKVSTPAASLSAAAYPGQDWLRATVPGTVLTTFIDDGVYPDPDFGLNNLQIPESLNKQDYWYRNVFAVPATARAPLAAPGHRAEITFQGINYKAEVWLNGTLLGTTKGAFRRATYDVTALLQPGTPNVLAVRISPPPHPGIPHEQSILGGAGDNGGTMALDGPTFLATEGWDWIPAIRDRNSGIWQPVVLHVTGPLQLGDAQVLVNFSHHDTARATVEIDTPVTNLSNQPLEATLNATLEGKTLHKTVTIPPGATNVRLLPADFPELNLDHPRLWWPNGYGKPELYSVQLALEQGTATASTPPSDTKTVRFGVREITYELSLLDPTGTLRRVAFTPAAAPRAPTPIVDVSHEGMREIPNADAIALHLPEDRQTDPQHHSNVASLAPGALQSPAIEPIADLRQAPYLVVVVNGVRIAVRGGNWGMDDSRKRVSREHLEPFFRLHRDANLNIIRNWLGQNTEETFYDLADEYGLLVWNDFWESTQNYNLEVEDPQLFLDNAADVIRRFRNHPSILLWCGRNEGVPQPFLNTGIEELVRTLDGTRYYSPSSNQVNLQGSGPYSFQPQATYYTTLNRGFSVETGTPSFSTLESFESTVPPEDRWPISDTWAYHDWHQAGNGRVAPFNAEIEAEFGAPTSLPDFERKAQMLNYVDHRAIFEGMNANLWEPNSGRLLWMTQPAWPSNMWQIFSSDYDTQASFYGTKKACEPLHIQLNLATYQVDIVNTTRDPHPGLTLSAKVFSLSNRLLFERHEPQTVAADALTHGLKLDLAPALANNVAIVELQLTDSSGTVLSRNLYWLASSPAGYRPLAQLPAAPMKLNAEAKDQGAETTLTVHLTNSSQTVSLANKLTLFSPNHQRILPAYFSDNYISLLPGQSQTLQITFPNTARPSGKGPLQLALRGWNAVPQTIPVAP